jgi:hypothetical protein
MRTIKRLGPLALFTICLSLLVGVGVAKAATTTIDFDAMTGPSVFCTAPSAPLTIGDATFSGGVVLTAASFLPADQSSVYGTTSCLNYAPAITIDFAVPVAGFSALVLNGNVVTVSYTVAADTGGSVTKTVVENFNSGAETFSLPDVGVSSVTISQTTPSSFWDFLIDNVGFTVLPSATGQCKHGGWQSFGVFKNQGDCVSYVATKGKNPPAG